MVATLLRLRNRNIEVAAEGRTGGDLQANRFGIHTLREVTATISTLKKLVQLFHASFNIVRRRQTVETAWKLPDVKPLT